MDAEEFKVAEDIEQKRLSDWKKAVEDYLRHLELMTERLRGSGDGLPSDYYIAELADESVATERAGVSFRNAVERLEKNAPKSDPAKISKWLSGHE